MRNSSLVLLIILNLSFVACKESQELESTAESNEIESPEPTTPQVPSHSEIYKILKMTCQKIVDCNQLNELKDCMTSQASEKNYATKLGLSTNEENFALWELIEMEVNLQITPDTSNAVLCLNQIDDLDCSDNNVVQAYDPLLEEPYQNVSGVLPLACQSVFNP